MWLMLCRTGKGMFGLFCWLTTEISRNAIHLIDVVIFFSQTRRRVVYLYIIEREKRDINLYKATGNLYASTMRQQKVARKKILHSTQTLFTRKKVATFLASTWQKNSSWSFWASVKHQDSASVSLWRNVVAVPLLGKGRNCQKFLFSCEAMRPMLPGSPYCPNLFFG